MFFWHRNFSVLIWEFMSTRLEISLLYMFSLWCLLEIYWTHEILVQKFRLNIFLKEFFIFVFLDIWSWTDVIKSSKFSMILFWMMWLYNCLLLSRIRWYHSSEYRRICLNLEILIFEWMAYIYICSEIWGVNFDSGMLFYRKVYTGINWSKQRRKIYVYAMCREDFFSYAKMLMRGSFYYELNMTM